MRKRILSISYDPALLWTRRLLLEEMGYEVVSAEGFTDAWEACEAGEFHLVILGHSVSPKDKERLIGHIKTRANTPILAMLRANESWVAGATQCVGADPETFIHAVRAMLPPK
jgi:DNA-binding NtrC family response regulator